MSHLWIIPKYHLIQESLFLREAHQHLWGKNCFCLLQCPQWPNDTKRHYGISSEMCSKSIYQVWHQNIKSLLRYALTFCLVALPLNLNGCHRQMLSKIHLIIYARLLCQVFEDWANLVACEKCLNLLIKSQIEATSTRLTWRIAISHLGTSQRIPRQVNQFLKANISAVISKN